ncbi:MAG: molybdenum cofactor biosynthesis protein MoaE [Myxococcota bacterium]|nr:molybdenum cofactor biosynthesis protein MoaE [Myxococcota bacterium]
MKVVVKLFGSVRDAVGAREIGLEVSEGATVGDLRGQLAAEHAVFDQLGERLAVSVNFELAEFDSVLAPGDEVAFLPPVSGGVGLCTISDQPLVLAEVAARVTGRDAGGVVHFVGAVRDRARGRDIEYLEYEAYGEMAEREMLRISDECAQRWPGTRVAIAHRTGHLEIGDSAVVIVAAAPHRAAAFEACRYAIDTLKRTVPIWKKEVATDGHYWVDDHA